MATAFQVPREIEDVGTTPRKPLSPMQRLKLFEAHGGICGLCGFKIMPGERWRDEHLRPLGLAGGNEMENRAPVHERCADDKNTRDLPMIAKAKRTKAKHLGIRTAKHPIKGWRRFNGEPVRNPRIRG